MKSLEDLMTIIWIIYFAVLLINIIVLISAYDEYYDLVKKENKEIEKTGDLIAATYWVNFDVFLFINDKTNNQRIQKVISKHTIAARVFWIWVAVVLPILIIIYSKS